MSSVQALDVEEVLKGTPYRAVARLGAGGMGELYEAVGPTPGERVVVKLLRAELASQRELVERMRVEGEVLELLAHRNIVAGLGHGTTSDGRPYVAMERLCGRTLQQELRRGPMRMAEAILLTKQLLSALRVVHEAGIVHRDVKPDNLMVCREGGRAELKLLDFGIAKVLEGRASVAPPAFPTLEGAWVGTPRYASPEQARGDTIDTRSDLYAAGIVLYTLVAGRGPFDDVKGAKRVLDAHITDEPPPPSRFAPIPVPPPLEKVILRAIAKDPDARFADALSFSRELVLVMGKLCMPLQPVLERADLDMQLVGPSAGAIESRTTVVARRFDEVPTVVAGGGRAGDTPICVTSMRSRRSRRPVPSSPPISRAGVLVSAAAFAAAASGIAMWLVRYCSGVW
jgi:serine/threonine-protein kinase